MENVQAIAAVVFGVVYGIHAFGLFLNPEQAGWEKQENSGR